MTAPAPVPAPSKPFRRLRLRLRPKCVGSGGSGSGSGSGSASLGTTYVISLLNLRYFSVFIHFQSRSRPVLDGSGSEQNVSALAAPAPCALCRCVDIIQYETCECWPQAGAIATLTNKAYAFYLQRFYEVQYSPHPPHTQKKTSIKTLFIASMQPLHRRITKPGELTMQEKSQ